MFTDLYHIKNSSFSEGKLEASVSLNADHPIFQGHFPGQPVLPGVCQLALAKELLEKHLQKSLTLRKGDQIKFMSMIDPRQTADVDVQIQVTETDDIIGAQILIFSGEVTFLKSKAKFANA